MENSLTRKKEQELLQISDLVNNHFNDNDLEKWNRFGHIQRVMCFPNRKFIIYKSNGKTTVGNIRDPEILYVATMTDLQADPYNGIKAVFTDQFQGKGETTTVSTMPSKLFGLPIFMWVSHSCDLQFNLRDVGPNRFTSEATFATVVKMQSAPNRENKNNIYLSEMNSFKERYPLYKDMVF